MLLPRRKSQLLKILIFITFTIFILTSIYYQLSVINQPPPQQQLSSSAKLLPEDYQSQSSNDTDDHGFISQYEGRNTYNRHHLHSKSDTTNDSIDNVKKLPNYNNEISPQLLSFANQLLDNPDFGDDLSNSMNLPKHDQVPRRKQDTIYRILKQQKNEKNPNTNSFDSTSGGDSLDPLISSLEQDGQINDQQNVPSPVDDGYQINQRNKVKETYQQLPSVNRVESLQPPRHQVSNLDISSNDLPERDGTTDSNPASLISSDNERLSDTSSSNESRGDRRSVESLLARRLRGRRKHIGKISEPNKSIVELTNNKIILKTKEEEQDDQQDAAVLPPPSNPTGPGEMGRPVVLKNLTKDQQDMVNVGWENNAFNQYISDLISFNRTLPDVRDPSCKSLKYPPNIDLPPTSVIICFHNEAWSVLLRTVHSIINRSPKRLVKEIILVDDFSNKPHLGEQLENYVRPLEIVKIVRAEKREGLIRARLLGARVATAPVLTFLDSHCECAEGWLEPLLTRIYQDSRTVVCPVIDVINDKTFEYQYRGDASAINVGGFDWNLQFNWHSIPEREKKRRDHPYDPVRSPTMAGGLFSINKAFFDKLGTYDSGFDIWGGENLELSFKTWMCGGTLEIIPCSHVGHIFRSRSPYKWRTGVNVLKRNSVRLAEVWMDEYKKYYYDRIGHDLGDFGDVSERVELRRQLRCKSFSYFVKEIYPELFIPGEAVAYGEVRNEAHGDIKMCLDSPARKTEMHKPLGVYPCHGAGGNQYWLLSKEGEIRRDEACVDYAGQNVILFPCHGSGGNQLWYYDQDSQHIRHSTSGMCMELAADRIKLKMSDCNPHNDAQRWTFQHYNQTLASMSSISQ